MKYKNIESVVLKRLSEVNSDEERELLDNVLRRVARFKQAEAGNAEALIELGEQILGTENDQKV